MTSKSLSSLWSLVNMLSYRDTSHKLCIYILFCYNSSLLNREVKFCQGKMSSGLLSQLTTCQKKTKWIPGEVFQTEKTLRLLREKLLIMTQPYQPCRRYFLVHNWWSVKWQSSITVYQSPIGSNWFCNKCIQIYPATSSQSSHWALWHHAYMAWLQISYSKMAALFSDFHASLDKDFKGFRSTFEAEILLSDRSLY